MAIEPDRFISSSKIDARSVEALNGIFDAAARAGASDIHFEDADHNTLVRFRVNGILHEHAVLDRSTALEMDAKIRMKSKMSIQERRSALDGRLFLRVDDRIVDVRVSILPTRCGQSTVCRLLDQSNANRRLNDIYLTPQCREALDDILAMPDGLMLVTGPTGSGKTSTLYAVLNELNNIETKIITVEDPVEYRLELVNQVEIQPGLSFAQALRSILRQDPDICMIGEVRDSETAKIAVQAAMTGHLVLSTLHANDAPTTLTRMVDLGADPFTLGAGLRCAIAQRLVRKLCEHCRTEYIPDASDLKWFKQMGIPAGGYKTFYAAGECGCDACGGTGFKGRLPVMEMILGDKAVRLAIDENDRQGIIAAARKQKQFETLAEAGTRLCAEGLTTLAEAQRISAESDNCNDGHHQLEAVRALLDDIHTSEFAR